MSILSYRKPRHRMEHNGDYRVSNHYGGRWNPNYHITYTTSRLKISMPRSSPSYHINYTTSTLNHYL